jgi:hypothetical protein
MDILNNGSGNKIVLQYRAFPPYFPSEPETVAFYYLHLSFDVITGKIPVTVAQAQNLAGLMLQIDRGDFTDEASFYSINLEDYVPHNLLYKLTYEDWMKSISRSYKGLVGILHREAKQSFIENLQDSPFFAVSSFQVQFMKVTGGVSLVLPTELLMSISARGVDLHTTSMTRRIMFFPYSLVVSWGVSRNILKLTAVYDHCQVSIYLSTVQARLIHLLSEAYALLSVNRPLKQVNESSCTRLEGLNRTQATRYNGRAGRLFDRKAQ